MADGKVQSPVEKICVINRFGAAECVAVPASVTPEEAAALKGADTNAGAAPPDGVILFAPSSTAVEVDGRIVHGDDPLRGSNFHLAELRDSDLGYMQSLRNIASTDAEDVLLDRDFERYYQPVFDRRVKSGDFQGLRKLEFDVRISTKDPGLKQRRLRDILSAEVELRRQGKADDVPALHIVQALGALGDIHAERGDTASAEEYFEEALDVSGVDPQLIPYGIWQALGNLYCHDREYDKAISVFEQYLEVREASRPKEFFHSMEPEQDLEVYRSLLAAYRARPEAGVNAHGDRIDRLEKAIAQLEGKEDH